MSAGDAWSFDVPVFEMPDLFSDAAAFDFEGQDASELVEDLDISEQDLGGYRRPADREHYWDGLEDERYVRPPLPPSKTVNFDDAQTFVRTLDIRPGARTFSFVTGRFIFGEVLEALVFQRMLSCRKIQIQTLSMNRENIDSIRNVCEMCPKLESLQIITSAYWYSTERAKGTGAFAYLYGELDSDRWRLDVAVASVHTKIMAIETTKGNHLVMHGSANLRSSSSVEQLAAECDDGLYEFVTDYGQRIIDRYNTVNHRAKKPVKGAELWRLTVEAEMAMERQREGAVSPRLSPSGKTASLSNGEV